MAAFTNKEFTAAMLAQPENALMRRYTHLGQSLLFLRHAELGDKLQDIERALDDVISLQRRNSALRAAGIISSSEIGNEQKMLVDDIEQKYTSFGRLLLLFNQIQSLSQPNQIELTSFKESLENLTSVDIKDTPWENEDDLVHIFPKRSEPLDRLSSFLVYKIHTWRGSAKLHALLKRLPRFIRRRLTLPEWEINDENAIPLVIRRDVLKNIISWTVVIVAPTLNVASMFVLYAVQSIWARIAIVWVFSLVLVLTAQLLSNRSDKSDTAFVFSIVSAFCAVLVVFVGSVPS